MLLLGPSSCSCKPPQKTTKKQKKPHTFSHRSPCKVPAAWPQGNALLHVIIFSKKDLGCRDNTSSWEALRNACHRTRRQQPKMAMSGPGYLQDLFLRAAKQSGHRPRQAPCATCRWPGHSSTLQVDEEEARLTIKTWNRNHVNRRPSKFH